jgi:capsular exopolysaccharide synthesis family protein
MSPHERHGSRLADSPSRSLVPLGVDGDPFVPAAAAGRGDGRPLVLLATPDLMGLLRVLQQRWKPAMGLAAVCAALATVAAWFLVPPTRYKASVLLQVAALPGKFLLETSDPKPDFKIYQATQLALIKSRLVLNAALNHPGVATLASARKDVGDPVEWLEKQIKVDLPTNSDLIQISIYSEHPEEIAPLANAVADAYMEEIVTKEYNERRARCDRMKEFLDAYQESLTEKRARRRKLAESVGSDNRQTLALRQQAVFEDLAAEKKELARVQAELRRSGVEIAVLESVEEVETAPEVSAAAIAEQLQKDVAIVQIEAQADELRRRIQRIQGVVRSESDPAMRRLRKELDYQRRLLEATRAKLRPAIVQQLQQSRRRGQSTRLVELRTQTKILADYEKILQGAVERLVQESKAFNNQTLDLQAIQDEIEQGEATAKKIAGEVEALKVELNAPHRVRIVERAESPRVENRYKRPVTVSLVGLGTLGCVLLGLSWREYRCRRVESVDEVVHGLGIRLVGTLPAMPPRRRQLAAPPAPDAGTAATPPWQDLLIESIDAVRTMLLRDLRTESLQVLLITSAAKGEGKSSLSSHLGISLARTGRRTLLIDLDLRSPTLHRLFDVPQEPGVCELFRDEAGVDEVIQPVMSDLDVIAAGSCDTQALQALGQDALPALLAHLRGRYDLIVIDSAPVLPVADTLQISQHVDAVVLSVYREVSRLPAVYAGYERLAMLGVRLLGVVVTGVRVDRHGETYAYGVRTPA